MPKKTTNKIRTSSKNSQSLSDRGVMKNMNKSITNKIAMNFGLISYLIVVGFASILFISSIFIGGMTWDEVYAIPMIQTHFAAALNNIPLDPNLANQHLIYYGIINLIPGYLLSLIFGEYHTCSHITIFIMSLIASYYVYKIAILLDIKKNIAYITGSLLLLYPVWIGHSFFNDKDTPAAVFFIIYSYYVCRVLCLISDNKKVNRNQYIKLVLTGSLLAATKFAFFPIIVVNSALLVLMYKSKLVSRAYFAAKLILFTLVLTLVFLPGSWHQPITYMINDISLMGKFDWGGCTKLFNECIITTSNEWNATKYLLSWYLVQMPLAFVLLFVFGIVFIIKTYLSGNVAHKKIWLILLVQLLFIPVLAMVHNSILYNATRHTLFCIPVIVLICGVGFQSITTLNYKYFRTVLFGIVGILLTIVVVDNLLLNPYQYVYFNELSRGFVNDKNTDTDYWGFSIREAYNSIDMMKYYSPYLNLEGPMPQTLMPYTHDVKFVHYDKNQPLPENVSVNLVGIVRDNEIDNRINPNNCVLVSTVSRKLLFKQDAIVMSKGYNCK